MKRSSLCDQGIRSWREQKQYKKRIFEYLIRIIRLMITVFG
jgi:hypothetical protein